MTARRQRMATPPKLCRSSESPRVHRHRLCVEMLEERCVFALGFDTGFTFTDPPITPWPKGHVFAEVVGEGNAVDIELQNDGKIVMGGSGSDEAGIFGHDFTLMRFCSTDGHLDDGTAEGCGADGFGTSGKVKFNVGEGQGPEEEDLINAIAIQEDGNIVAVGRVLPRGRANWAVARFIGGEGPDAGEIDTTFGCDPNEPLPCDGKVIINFSNSSEEMLKGQAFGVAIQSDDKIVIVGTADFGTERRLAVARLTPDGQFDSNFQSGGKLTLKVDGLNSGASAVELLPSMGGPQKIVVAGSVDFAFYDKGFAALRLCADGHLDDGTDQGCGPGFGNNGVMRVNLTDKHDTPTGLTLLSDGTTVITGVANKAQGILAPSDLGLIKLTPNGHPDTNFGAGNGIVTLDIDTIDRVGGIVAEAGGNIVVVGGATPIYIANRFFVARFAALGDLLEMQRSCFPDAVGDGSSATGVVLQPDGKIVAGGFHTPREGSAGFSMIRFVEGGPKTICPAPALQYLSRSKPHQASLLVTSSELRPSSAQAWRAYSAQAIGIGFEVRPQPVVFSIGLETSIASVETVRESVPATAGNSQVRGELGASGYTALFIDPVRWDQGSVDTYRLHDGGICVWPHDRS